MNNKRGRKKKGYIRISSSVPPSTYSAIEQRAEGRGLDIAAIIREALIEKFGIERSKARNRVIKLRLKQLEE